MQSFDFSGYPSPIKDKLLTLRGMILDVAKNTPGVGKIEEGVRWGQASYLTSESCSGSTIRIDQVRGSRSKYAMYFICTSGLVEEFRELYPREMKFDGNRSIVFDVSDKLPKTALRHCISLALTFHMRKRSVRLKR